MPGARVVLLVFACPMPAAAGYVPGPGWHHALPELLQLVDRVAWAHNLSSIAFLPLCFFQYSRTEKQAQQSRKQTAV